MNWKRNVIKINTIKQQNRNKKKSLIYSENIGKKKKVFLIWIEKAHELLLQEASNHFVFVVVKCSVVRRNLMQKKKNYL